jgi:hypothetical protein
LPATRSIIAAIRARDSALALQRLIRIEREDRSGRGERRLLDDGELLEVVGAVDQDEGGDAVRMREDDLLRQVPAHRLAHEYGALDPHVIE